MSTPYSAVPDGDGVVITAGHQRLRFAPGHDGRLRYRSEVQRGDGWVPVAEIPNTLVQGASFDLAPSRYRLAYYTEVRPLPAGREVLFYGTSPFPWQASVSANPGSQWFSFLIKVEPPVPIALKAIPFLEPWCVTWLGSVDRLRWTQHDTWRQTTIAAPTRSSTGAPGNDLPATYFYDVAHQAEICFYADLTTMAWMSEENLARFRDMEIGPVWDGAGRYGVGMHAARRTGTQFPAGRSQFAYKLWQRHRATPPTEAEALSTLIELCAPLLEPDKGPISDPRKWSAMAEGTLAELRSERALVTVGSVSGHPAYMPEPDRTGSPGIELMTQVDVLAPLSLLANVDDGARAHADKLAASLQAFWRPATSIFGNGLPAPDAEEVVDSWYLFENALIKLAWIARARRDRMLQERVRMTMVQARELAHRCQYLFPLFFVAGSNAPTGNGWNVAVNGLYAYACMLTRDATRDEAWLQEAARALRTLANAPLSLLYHEPQELAFGSLAAGLLAESDRAGEWLTIGRHLVDAQLRMAYWYSDPIGLQAGYDIRGGFQACAGLLYPAFKENVESVLPWIDALARFGLSPLLLRFLDLQRRHNRAFLRDGSNIPVEDLGTLELGRGTGRLGREIYGAGEVLWMALAFDTLARADDPEICVIWLDVLNSWETFPPAAVRLAVFNPTLEPREVHLSLPLGGSTPPFTLKPAESIRLEIARLDSA
ncbi:MAG: hypothetical protein M3Z11_06255 [Candidatus Dormibacteraeota bacterium]|nr:hypothetical protein [Candidatus Dormibacteraeota bacterium]